MSDRPKVTRKFDRHEVNCPAMLAFPARNAHPRIKARLVQIGKGGCSLSADESLFIGEECLVWATEGAKKYLGVPGVIVWVNPVYTQGHQTFSVGVEFKTPIEVTPDLLKLLTKPRAYSQG